MEIKSEFKKEKIKILVMVILIAGACFLTYYFHAVVRTGRVFTHLFYIPIILSALWWKRKGLIIAIFLVAYLIFSHFFIRTDVEAINDLLRAPMFILVAFITIFLTEKIVKVKDMLSEKNEYLEKLINHANAPIIVWDKQGSIIRFNTAFEELTKYKSSELIGKHFSTIFNGRTEEEVLRKIEQTLKGEYLKSVEITVLNKQGNELILLWNSVNVYSSDGKNMIATIAQGQDITELKRAEAVIKKERNFSKNIIATVPDSLVVVDKDLRIKSANRSFYEIFQMEPENVISASITEILGDRDGELSTELTKLFGTEDILDGFELQYQSKKLGKRILNIIARTIIFAEEEEEEEEELIVLQDITERKQAEETLQRFNEELEQKVTERTVELDKKIKESEQQRITTVNIANDLEETNVKLLSEIAERKQAEEELKKYRDHLEELVKERTKELEEAQKQLIRKERLTVLGQLSGGVAHELRNPLGVISNSIYYLNMKLKDKDEKVKKHLGLIKKEIEISDNMIIELLDFSKVKLLYITETNVNTLIKETIEETKIPEYIALEMDLDEKIPQLQLDPDKMQRVFQNMISNAIQAMPEKGKLYIKTSSNDDFTEISFSDNGQGIVKENLKKIFEPLVTTRVAGIGLGLAIAKNIIDYHKGKIDVKSEVGKGTTFTIKLRNYEVEKL